MDFFYNKTRWVHNRFKITEKELFERNLVSFKFEIKNLRLKKAGLYNTFLPTQEQIAVNMKYIDKWLSECSDMLRK